MREILSKCKCGVFFTANEHRDYYETAEKWLINQCQDQRDIDDIGKEVWDEMIKRDIIYVLQFYPNTPVGSYKIYHYDYNELLKIANKVLMEI